jgi:N-acetylneuraminic acid mutarotase
VAVELNGLIYVIGGNDPDTCAGNYRCAQLASVDIYNPSTNTWSIADALNERRDVAGAVVYDDKIYVVGGMYSESGDVQVSNRDSLEMYDPNTNTWTIVNRDIPYPGRSAATVLVDDVIYVIGGCSEHDADLDELEAENTCTQTVVQTYDIGDADWTVLENNMPTGRHFSGQHAVAVEEGILVFGGSTDLSATTYSTVEALRLSSTTWTYATDMQARRKSSASVLYNNYLYVTGGTAHGEGYSSELTDGMERTYVGNL